MRTATAVSGAMLFAGTAFVLPARAQTAPQWSGTTAQPQTQQYGSPAHHTQPSGTASETQSGMTTPTQIQSRGAMGAEMGTPGQLPQGSYRSSCNDVRMQNDTLIAFCRKPDGTWQTSAIGPANQCVGDIQNVNGQLVCNETGAGSSTPPARPQSPPAQLK